MWCSHLRYDTLAQMLTLGNIHAGSKVLVFETCAGLVLGAIMERMGGRCSLTSCVHHPCVKSLSCLCGLGPEPFFFPVYNDFLFSLHPGYGSVIQMFPGGGPVRPGVECFGFPAHFHDMLHEFPICHVNALLAGTLSTSAKDPTAGLALLYFILFFYFFLTDLLQIKGWTAYCNQNSIFPAKRFKNVNLLNFFPHLVISQLQNCIYLW